MAEIEKKWYVLRAISGKAAKVKEYLEADLKNSDLGEYVSRALIPTEKVYQVRNGKNCERKEVIFLVTFWWRLLWLVRSLITCATPECDRLFRWLRKPVPLRQSEVNRILWYSGRTAGNG